MARGIALVFAVSATLALAPTVAEAATQRYAAPGGATNVDCTNHDQPCDLPTAFTNAQPNDEVIVETGDYGSATTPLTQPIVSTKAGLDVHGEDGKPRPRIFTNAPIGLDVRGAGSRVRDLEIDQVSTLNQKVGLDFSGAEVTRLVVHDKSPDGIACVILADSVLSNSVCDETGQGGWAVRGYNQAPATNHCVLRNVTALAPSGNAIAVVNAMDVDEDITVTNSIALGGGPSNGSDVYAFNQDGGGIARISINHSYYFIRNVHPTGTGPEGIIQDDGTDVRGPQPKFAAAGDYHQAAGSSTIDKGATSPANGAIDLDGDSRTLGKSTDIGADEFLPPPTVTTGAPGAVTQSTAVVNGTVNPSTRATSYHFEYGTTATYGASTPAADAGAGGADVPVSATLSGLAASTTYHYRLVATNAVGTTFGADRTVVTQSPGGGGGGGGGSSAGPHFVGPLVLTPTSFAAAASGPSVRAAAKRKAPIGTNVTFTLDKAASVRFRVEKALPGRRVGGRCVKPTRKNRKARGCTRYKLLPGGFTFAALGAQNRFRFTGRLSGAKLAPGRYRLKAVATDLTLNSSAPKRASFKIVRR